MEIIKKIGQSTALAVQQCESLRRLAEERAGTKPVAARSFRTKEATQRLDHELEVHQIELEMQNAELHQTRDELEITLEKYSDLFDFAPVGYFTLTRNGIVSAVNLSGAGLLGIMRSRLIGKHFEQFVSAADRPAFNDFLAAVLNCRIKESCEVALSIMGNQTVVVRIEAMVTASGQEFRLVLIDITQSRQMEEQALRLASFPQLNPNPVLEVDTSGTVIFANPAAHRILGNLRIAEENVNAFIPPDLNVILEAWDRQNEKTDYREIIIGDKVFGETILLTPLFNAVRIYCLDITDRKRAEEALQKTHDALEQRVVERTRELAASMDTQRDNEQMLLQQSRLAAMGEMINNIAHQWRQPLNVLALLVQQIQIFYDSGSLSKEELDSCVDKSMNSINHMSQTIDDFRNFFKPDKKQVVFKIGEVVAKTVSLVEDSFNNMQIRIDFQTVANPSLLGFPNEYSQVLLNILMNARDALQEKRPDGAKVTITIRIEGEKTVVTIADNAGGIADEIMGKIFEPYFTTKGPDKGTGVGLFMSKTIIEKNMNGRLTARNTAEGAEFRIEV